jgi:adenine-specific DNA glycosylase
MLQQTQVATVLPYYQRWLMRFPDFAALARADESDVLHAWQGLGYYARARRLHAVGKFVTEHCGGQIPFESDRIAQLPGVGRYTAGAIASFAFNRSEPIVDANIARVLARLTNWEKPIDAAPAGSSLADCSISCAREERARSQPRFDGPGCNDLPAARGPLRGVSGAQILSGGGTGFVAKEETTSRDRLSN